MGEPIVLELRAGGEASLRREIAALLARVRVLLVELAPAADPRGADLLAALAAEYARPGPADGADVAYNRLAGTLGLSPLDREVLLLAGVAEEHEAIATLLAGLHPRGEPRATAGLAAQLLTRTAADRDRLRAALVHGPLARSGAIRVAADTPFFHATLSVPRALWFALRGEDDLPEGLAPAPGGNGGEGDEGWMGMAEARRAITILRRGERWLIAFAADRDRLAEERSAALASAAGVPALRLSPGAKVRGEGMVAHLALRGAVPLIASTGSTPFADLSTPLQALEAWQGPILFAGSAAEVELPRDRCVLDLPCAPASAGDRARAWRAALPELSADAGRLAAAYALEPSAVRAAAHDARRAAALDGRPPSFSDVAAGVRARRRGTGSAAVVMRRPTAGWSDLVLPPGQLAQLGEALARLRNAPRVLDDWGFLRGRPGARGVRLLLSGPPGTGKTLAAEVLARELGVDLLIVDLSKVVSKWLGETEKQLAGVFAAAEEAHAVLLFDEADALFARRTEVEDAHDRYANLETAYLLYRLERFDGLAVLSTNLKRNVDSAFLRRLEFVLELEEPDEAMRLELWRRHIPPAAPVADDVDLAAFAEHFAVTGALIRNAATAAGFLAADAGTPITAATLLRGVLRELEKAGRACPTLPPGRFPLEEIDRCP